MPIKEERHTLRYSRYDRLSVFCDSGREMSGGPLKQLLLLQK